MFSCLYTSHSNGVNSQIERSNTASLVRFNGTFCVISRRFWRLSNRPPKRLRGDWFRCWFHGYGAAGAEGEILGFGDMVGLLWRGGIAAYFHYALLAINSMQSLDWRSGPDV